VTPMTPSHTPYSRINISCFDDSPGHHGHPYIRKILSETCFFGVLVSYIICKSWFLRTPRTQPIDWRLRSELKTPLEKRPNHLGSELFNSISWLVEL
jgi:hypothetical protein